MTHYKSFINLLLVILLFNCNIIDVKGQAPEMNNRKWRGIGPAHFGGRVTCVTGLPGDYKTYFVGTAAGKKRSDSNFKLSIYPKIYLAKYD